IRLVRQFNMPASQRVEMCANALAAAKRPDEQKMVLEVAARYPSLEMLKVAAQSTKKPGLERDANQAAFMIAQKLGKDRPEVKKVLAEFDVKPPAIEVLKAEYGAGKKWKDVTPRLREASTGSHSISLKTPKYNDAFGGDPAPGVIKVLRIQYRIDGKIGTVTLAENAPVVLPTPK
ncbi:MAG: DUF3395 domain-containing protein, partial [Pirellulales bacterium]|nr:DUF3395 domain-containing protein [Pirellulales bacterium]